MKRFIAVLAILLCLASVSCFAAGSSVTYSSRQSLSGGETKTVTLAWIGDDGTGAVPTTSTNDITLPGTTQTVTSWIQGYYLCDVEVNPGSVAPTALYDIAITDAGGASLSNGALDDLSATVTQIRRMAGYSGADSWIGCQYITGPLTLTWTNTIVNSSTGTITLYLSKP